MRTPISELRDGLEPEMFWQVHRGAIVNAHAIDRAVREDTERLVLFFKGHPEKVVVSAVLPAVQAGLTRPARQQNVAATFGAQPASTVRARIRRVLARSRETPAPCGHGVRVD